MGFKTHVARKVGAMFGVLFITMLLTIILIGANMDSVLKQGVVFQVRSELASDSHIAASFSDHAEFEEYIQTRIVEREKALGLDKAWNSPQRIGYAMYRIITLDFGQAVFLTSDAGSSNVLDILAEKLPRTMLLFTSSTGIIAVIGILIGASSAAKVGSTKDKLTSAFAVVSSSFPVWWIGMLMIFFFAFVLRIFPARATPDISPGDPGYLLSLAYHMVLPLVTIVLIGFGAWSYFVRNFMVGAMQDEHILAKKTIGIPKRKIVYSHALRNAAPPIITILALSVSGSLGGAIITEAVFDWPGMGRLYFEAITVTDLPVIIGATYTLTVFFLASILVADLLYGYFDPRVRRS
ncbi:MAG: peptide ABC transporter permease [Cenarchaeum symbiont of Oopsacas minuta]|nr:peptide ABC transporter permease [Cenarchaeum symbiont of Oopsacas minuta]